ncbi:MAG: TetR/AcrR family transcriptional regulator [Clostridiales bacterium]|nr:TetR/AcrR family transcriptional regulator [Clostridiales bacterium]
MQNKGMKYKIAAVFLDLVKRKNIDKITVKDISEACGITRQGFYYHFEDILDLMEWILKSNFEKSLEKSPEKGDSVKAVEELIRISIDKADIINKFLKYKEREAVERITIKTIRDFVKECIEEREGASPETDVLTDFYFFGIAGAITGICGREVSDIMGSAEALIKIIGKSYIE